MTFDALATQKESHPLGEYDDFLHDAKKTTQDAVAIRKSIEDTGKYLKYKSQQYSQMVGDVDAKSQILTEIEQTKQKLEANF